MAYDYSQLFSEGFGIKNVFILAVSVGSIAKIDKYKLDITSQFQLEEQ